MCQQLIIFVFLFYFKNRKFHKVHISFEFTPKMYNVWKLKYLSVPETYLYLS